MPVDTYEVALLDPFGHVICSMTYSSFAPEDDAMNFFAPLLGNNKEGRYALDATHPATFSVRITRK